MIIGSGNDKGFVAVGDEFAGIVVVPSAGREIHVPFESPFLVAYAPKDDRGVMFIAIDHLFEVLVEAHAAEWRKDRLWLKDRCAERLWLPIVK